MSFFVLSVLCYLTPQFAILSMQPVFFFQFLLDIRYANMPWPCKSKGHKTEFQNTIDKNLRFERWHLKIREFFHFMLENKSVRFLAFLLQILGIVGFVVFIVVEANVRKEMYLFPAIVLPLSLATLSIVWSNKVQVYLVTPRSKETSNAPLNARSKASKF